jgi:pimeloyl-ACP methyl ester carboxylesterase
LLLIAGLGGQMIEWDDEFCAQLARRGYRVIRFDNRDVGLSTKLDDAGVPDIPALMQAAARGEPLQVPYLLQDMADDAASLLDALNIASAHVVGHSMGGMIAQELAIRHPARVRTLTSIASTTGNSSLPPPALEAMAVLMTPPPDDLEGYVASTVQTCRAGARSTAPTA